jgi:hypothetical protein
VEFSYGLVVSEAKGGHVLVLEGELLQVLDDFSQLGQDEVQSAFLEDQVGVVGDLTGLAF